MPNKSDIGRYVARYGEGGCLVNVQFCTGEKEFTYHYGVQHACNMSNQIAMIIIRVMIRAFRICVHVCVCVKTMTWVVISLPFMRHRPTNSAAQLTDKFPNENFPPCKIDNY